jgi:hypothetical protein
MSTYPSKTYGYQTKMESLKGILSLGITEGLF